MLRYNEFMFDKDNIFRNMLSIDGAYSYKIVTQRRRNVYVYRRKNYADGTYDVDIFKSRQFCCVDDAKISDES